MYWIFVYVVISTRLPHGSRKSKNRLKSQSIDRWVVGIEKTVFDGWASVELRLPFYELDQVTPPFTAVAPGTQFRSNSGTLGNLSVILKKMIDYDECAAWSWGLGIETPTADDTTILTGSTRYGIDNDVVRLSPFLALTEQLSDRWFVHGFTQLEIPLGSYDVRFDDRFDPADNGPPGKYTDPVSVMFDAGAGYWILPPSRSSRSTLAVLTEVHYTLGLTDPDRIAFARTNSFGLPVNSVLAAQRPNYLNFTVGLHWATRSGWEVRAGSAFPMTRNDRLFDIEPMIQVGRLF